MTQKTIKQKDIGNRTNPYSRYSKNVQQQEQTKHRCFISYLSVVLLFIVIDLSNGIFATDFSDDISFTMGQKLT